MTTLANFSAESKKSSLRIFKEQQVWFYKKVFSSSCSSGQLLQFWRTWRIFSPLCHKLQYPSKKLEIFNSFFQKPCFVSVPLDTYNLVLNSKPKLFQCVPILPGQRSKLMRNQLSKNAFAEVFSPGHVCYSFEDRAIFFHYKSKYVCLQSDNYKKHDYSELIFLTIFLCTRWLLFRHTRIVSWPRDEKNSLKVQKIQKNKTKSILKKKIPQLFSLDALMTLVTTLKKTFRPKGPKFWLRFRRSLKHCAKFQTRFILNTFQGYIGCSFDNSGELLRY